ncbi:MAG: YdeI/OmpD-associated family protein, partial [Chloroflexota bacterium]|nr:YdeI/OmpD-associated family protein [Chloroflexota bacterium]
VLFRSNEHAWTFFQDQAPWYRRTAIRWVTSAKREETRRRRLSALIADSGQGRTIPSLTRPTRTKDQS